MCCFSRAHRLLYEFRTEVTLVVMLKVNAQCHEGVLVVQVCCSGRIQNPGRF